jgi:hypothetical protein
MPGPRVQNHGRGQGTRGFGPDLARGSSPEPARGSGPNRLSRAQLRLLGQDAAVLAQCEAQAEPAPAVGAAVTLGGAPTAAPPGGALASAPCLSGPAPGSAACAAAAAAPARGPAAGEGIGAAGPPRGVQQVEGKAAEAGGGQAEAEHTGREEAVEEAAEAEEGEEEQPYSDDEFGFLTHDRLHTLRTFRAYCEWAKRRHFSSAPAHAILPLPDEEDAAAAAAAAPGAAHAQTSSPAAAGASASGASAAARAASEAGPSDAAAAPGPSGAAAGAEPAARADAAGAGAAAAAAGAGAYVREEEAPPLAKRRRRDPLASLSIEAMEAEFWRIVERPDPNRVVETLYGSDLDSGRHGSGFPLPPWRGLPTDARTGALRLVCGYGARLGLGV